MQSLVFIALLLGLVSVAAVPLNRADNRCPAPVVSGNGNFTSPYYGQTNYDNGDFCIYQFNTVITGYRAVIKCLDFDTTPGTDYLVIFDGPTNTSTPIANISGGLPNPNTGYASSGQYFFAQFSANSDRTGRGFLCAHRTWRECQAQRTFNADQGSVSSPYYNDAFYPYYFSNINCDYNINVPGSSNVVGFTIANFSIGPTETLTLYDGPDANAQMIYSIQGADSINYPKTFRTNFGNQLYVLFQSGTDNPPSRPVYGGWTANFDTRLSCSQTYNDVNGGTITSPDYDGLTNYSPMLNCTSTVDYSSIAGQGRRVVVSFTFTRFALQAGDVVTLYDGRNPLTDPVLAVLTGNHDGDTYYSTQPYLTWTMTSDINVEDVGFTANHAVTDTCNVNYNVSASSLASANYPQNYPNNANCMYTIQLPDPNTIAAITFDFFDTELCCDYIVIFDGIGGAPLYQLGGTAPQGNTYCASTNSMQIQFVSDGAINRKGFHGNFIAKTDQSGCASKQAGPPPKVPKEAY